MYKRILLSLGVALAIMPTVTAQRVTDALGRGLVAMKTDNGVFCSWRINADEWDGTEYNIYRGNTKLNSTPLKVSNFTDASGSTNDTYTVKPVINGVEADACAPVKAWEKNYTIIKPQHAPEIKTALVPNDATVADVDGDGELEILMKYDNTAASFSKGDNGIFTVVECLEMDGSVKWWINFGPNMGDFQNNEINIIATDWDGDGKAEVVFRAADGTIIHQADGSTYTIGDPSINYRGTGDSFPSGQWFMRWGKEYLVYANGETGKPYECIDYPLMRVEPANNPKGILSGSAYDSLIDSEWGDGYGHRSSKYFFGAPYLDGRKPSLFLARGIYTKHKMIAYDIDPATHKLIERWRWNDLGGAWHGQGYHNFGIADVDWDGRDEIVYGSMVIDDNGYGLSTTGLGHGDAQHCSDFDPYSHGQEIFACNEDNPNNNFRDATTSKIYYRTTSGNDDGRSMMGKFIDEYPGAQGISSRDNALIGGASHKAIIGDSKSNVSITQNFRVYWDGDLCEETFDYSNGKNTAGAIYNARKGRIALLEGSMTNNDTKGTPCFQGDILGDWREEYIMRDANNNIRIYSTNYPTEHRIYSLWYDHQYRNAMNWQMCGYNQPPHVSFYLGQSEGITVPPAPLTMTGRIEIPNNGTINASLNGKHVIICETGDMTLSTDNGVAPSILTINTPTWVEGHNNNNNITTKTFTHTITGGTFGGDMHLIKQGDGMLVMPKGKHSYSGNTDIWAGTIAIDGELSNSHIWINRFGKLVTDGGKFPKGIEMNYASELTIGNDEKAGAAEISTLELGFGARVNIDLFADGSADCMTASTLNIETKDWTNGPEYLRPVIKFTAHPAAEDAMLPAGDYVIGTIGAISGNVSDLIVEGLNGLKADLKYTDGKLVLSISDTREATDVVWTGAENGNWELSDANNFKMLSTGESTSFVAGDRVVFDDSANVTEISIPNGIYPSKVIFNNNEKTFKLSGAGFEGECEIEKKGTGRAILNNSSTFTGKTSIYNGVLEVNSLGANEGTATGALGHYSNEIVLDKGGILAINNVEKSSHNIIATAGGIEVMKGTHTIVGAKVKGNGTLVKSGTGQLNLAVACEIDTLRLDEGAVYDQGDSHSIGKVIVFNGKNVQLIHNDSRGSYSTDNAALIVNEGKSGKLSLDGRCAYKGKLTGKGSLEVYAPWIRNTLEGNWSEFEGTITATQRASSGGNDYGSSFDFNSNKGLDKAKLTVDAGTTFNIERASINVGALSGTGVIGNEGKNFVILGNGEDSYINGTFGKNVNVQKNGPEYITINKAQPNMGSLSINDGILELNSSDPNIGTMTGVAPMTVKSTIMGSGVCGNSEVTLTQGAVIAPTSSKKSSKFRTIAFRGNLILEPGSEMTAEILANDKYSKISVDGKLTNKAAVKVKLNGYKPALGDEFILWTAAEAEGTPALELPALPDGFYWNTEGITPTEGKLVVTDVNAVIEIEASKIAECAIFNISGIRLNNFTSTVGDAIRYVKNLGKGIYVLRYTTDGVTRSIKLEN